MLQVRQLLSPCLVLPLDPTFLIQGSETNTFSASQGFHHSLRSPRDQYHVHDSPALNPTLSQLHPYTFPFPCVTVHIIFPPSLGLRRGT